jgi:hypothetical protein
LVACERSNHYRNQSDRDPRPEGIAQEDSSKQSGDAAQPPLFAGRVHAAKLSQKAAKLSQKCERGGDLKPIRLEIRGHAINLRITARHISSAI